MTVLEATTLLRPFVKLRQRGGVLIGRCPFHAEDTPSFTVYPALEHYHCFGCGKGGHLNGLLWELKKQKESKSNGNN